MTALALRAPASRPILGELLARQPTLARYGLLLVALTIPCVAMQWLDARTFEGANVWVKPAKFLFSVGVFALTSAWFCGYVRPERRDARSLRWMTRILLASGTFEVAYIAWQAAHALLSHFNRLSMTGEILYGLMGFAAVLLVGTTLVVAWEIARRPAAGYRPVYLASVVVGLLLCFVLGGGLGGYMAQQPGHAVGATGGRLPLVGWNRGGGDLRIAHFLGIHAQQALPTLGAALTRVPARWQMPGLAVGALLFTVGTALLFVQAVAGKAFL